MTTAQVRTAWDTNVFTAATVIAITDKIYDKRMDRGGSTKEISLLKYKQEFNWIEYTVQRFAQGGMIGQRRYEYLVRVNVCREVDPDSTNHNDCLDALDTIEGLVISALGVTWGSTVDLWQDVSRAPSIDEIEISGKRIIVCSQEYRAEEYI